MFLISFLQSTAFTVYQLHVIGWKEWGEIITYIKDDKVALKAKKLTTYLGEINDKKGVFFRKVLHILLQFLDTVYICLLLYSLG